jgi:hypothetical protein
MRWKKGSKWEKRCLVNIFPNHVVAWGQREDQYDGTLGFLMMLTFRIQARNPFISCMVILVQFFSRAGTLLVLLLIVCCTYLLNSVTMWVRIKYVKKDGSKQYEENQEKAYA